MRKKVTVILAVLAFISVAAAGVGKAYAYFTTYVEARGSHEIRIEGQTEIEENFNNWKKDVRIKNKDDSKVSYWVRVKAFASQDYRLDISGEGWSWSERDDYWYYDQVIDPGDVTKVLSVKITDSEDESPAAEPNGSMDVVITYETVLAIPTIDDDGNMSYEPADWSFEEQGD